MVGIQCKSCAHRALATPESPKPDHEILTLLSQSPVTCSQCGGSKYSIVMFPANAADTCLKGDAG